MTNFNHFFKQNMTRFFALLFAGLMIIANIGLYVLLTIQYNREINRQTESLIEMIEHLILQEDMETSIIYLEHYDHTHGVSMIFSDEQDVIRYQSLKISDQSKTYFIMYQDTYLGKIELDFQSARFGKELTLGLIIFNVFSFSLFVLSLSILYRYINKQYQKVNQDLIKVGSEEKEFVFKDISLINDRYLEALQAEKQTKELQAHYVNVLAHDIKTPLTVMKAYLEGVHLGRIEYSKTLALELLDEIKAIESLIPKLLIKDLKEIIKLQNVSLILKELLENIKEVMLSKKITLHASIEDVDLNISRNDFQRLAEHLIFNAFYYSNEKSHIWITLSNQDMLFSVKDEGIGMSYEDIQSIKKGSFRSQDAQKMHPKGSGIGLKIVDEIIKKYHFDLDISSQVNQGSTFTIKFKPKQ